MEIGSNLTQILALLITTGGTVLVAWIKIRGGPRSGEGGTPPGE